MINRSEFLLKEIPNYSPVSKDYISFWREQKRRIIEGHWVGGYWMPPKLYFYSNFGTIKLNKGNSNIKSYGRPLLRDVEWDFFYNWTVARGFSGFENDPYFSCDSRLIDDEISIDDVELFNPYGELKTYVDPLEYIRKRHETDLGRPLYNNSAKNMMMLGARNFGKDISWDSTIHYEDRKDTISNVKVGDRIYGQDGKLTTVQAVEKYTDQLQYEFKLKDGRTIKAGLGHKWYVKEKLAHTYVEHVKTTEEILKNFRNSARKDYNYWIPLTQPLEYSAKDLPIDPYLLGVLIGDGCITQYVTFTSNDPEILDYLKTSDRINKLKAPYQYSITGGSTLQSLKDLNLFKKTSSTKFIPSIYLKGSIEQRLELLKGLLDTDGYISKSGNIEYTTNSFELSKDFVDLARSLGLYVNDPVLKNKSYRIYLRSNIQLFKLKRKQERLKEYNREDYKYVAIESITPAKIEDSYCIQVDNESKLFLANSFIPTHNSYMVGVGIILHDFLTDSAFSYEEHLKGELSAEIMVGAYDSKYTRLILEKTRDALEKLPGETTLGDRLFPSPFSRKYKGSWGPGSEVTFSTKKKIGGSWKSKGTNTNIKNRTFADNPTAGVGSRPLVFILEEVGLCKNVKEIHAAMKDAQRDDYKKFASSMYLGTGGDMEAGALACSEIMYNPDSYEMLSFADNWEGKGKICYFVPAYLARTMFKDDNGFTKVDEAKKYIINMREKLQSGSSEALNKEIINNPLVPSEMFLTKSSNIFPVAEISRRKSVVEHELLYEKIVKKVELFFDPNSELNGVNYQIDMKNKLTPIDTFPWTSEDRDGAVVIYELPQTIDGVVPDGAYIIGHDPYKDDTNRGASLGAIYVIKTAAYFDKIGHDEIVATYIGRPYLGRDIVNENLLKLSLFYGNAKIYFENSVGNVKDYFERTKHLHLLARKPHTLFTKKGNYETSPLLEYGYPMSNEKIKYEALQYLRTWLLEVRESSDNRVIRNLDRIVDKALLQELLTFSMEGNFDRIMALCGAIIGLNEVGNVKKNELISSSTRNNFMDVDLDKFITNNRYIFRNETFSETKISL